MDFVNEDKATIIETTIDKVWLVHANKDPMYHLCPKIYENMQLTKTIVYVFKLNIYLIKQVIQLCYESGCTIDDLVNQLYLIKTSTCELASF